MERKVKNRVTGFRTQDGAGVSLVRVLGGQTVEEYDPFLMLDSFDSVNPDDYTAGFPMHPHRGIETISYVYKGAMQHRDNLGNVDTVKDGGIQWMTAGSGIMHEEQIPATERMLGIQLWLNLPKKDKFAKPNYKAIRSEDIEEIPFENGKIRLLAGNYEGHKGYMSNYLPLDYYDIHLAKDKEIEIKTEKDKSVILFTLIGEIEVAGEKIAEKTAVKLSEGDFVRITSRSEMAQILFLSSERLGESVAWGGPIVMNTREELQEAFEELNNGTFIKDSIEFDD